MFKILDGLLSGFRLRVYKVFVWRLIKSIYKEFWILIFVILMPLVIKSMPLKNANPFELYPKGIIFNVLRNDEIVGKHRVSFVKLENKKFRTIAQLNLQVNFLTFPIYKFDYKSDATWLNGKLISLRANQNDDGQNLIVKVSKKNNWLTITTPDSQFWADLDDLPTNHWNAEVLTRDKVINTLTGKLSSVIITNLGKEKIVAQGKSIFGTKYKYTGDINTLVWYSDNGNWVKMQFEGNDGSNIDYECIECGLGQITKKDVEHQR
jgi:hypothetical protein